MLNCKFNYLLQDYIIIGMENLNDILNFYDNINIILK